MSTEELKEAIDAMTPQERQTLRENFAASLENDATADEFRTFATDGINLIDQA